VQTEEGENHHKHDDNHSQGQAIIFRHRTSYDESLIDKSDHGPRDRYHFLCSRERGLWRREDGVHHAHHGFLNNNSAAVSMFPVDVCGAMVVGAKGDKGSGLGNTQADRKN
jgi:hypothetical protein